MAVKCLLCWHCFWASRAVQSKEVARTEIGHLASRNPVNLLTYSFTYSIQHRLSWESNRFSASQETPQILWNPKVHYRIHKCPPPVHILSQLDLIRASRSQFLNIHLYIIFPSTSGSRKRSLSIRFPHLNPVHPPTLAQICYMSRPSNSSRFYHLSSIEWGVQIIKLFIMQFSPLPCYLVPLRPKHSSQTPSAYIPHSIIVMLWIMLQEMDECTVFKSFIYRV